MKIYVWRGNEVLKNYSSGMVVIAAQSASEAWEKLQSSDFRAHTYLQIGQHLCAENQEELDREDEDYKIAKPGFPIQPIEYDPTDLPILVIWGGE